MAPRAAAVALAQLDAGGDPAALAPPSRKAG